MTTKPNYRLFRILNLISIIAVYLLILVGGIVRSTGSGMGCPDWPKCFGQYVPPTSAADLPADYKEIYSQKRHEKNLRVAAMMRSLGMHSLAAKITQDESILVEQTFNPTKTWIEYLNRLLGVLVGFFILSGFISSFKYWSSRKSLFFLSLSALLLVIFQGWIGSIVVSTNLLPGMITFHMLLAIGLIALLLKIRHKVTEGTEVLIVKKYNTVRSVLVACIALFLTQIVLGTQVREAIDTIADRLGEAQRGLWIENLGLTFYVHRSYSLLLLVVHLVLVVKLFRGFKLTGLGRILAWSMVVMIILEIATGTVLAYFALPYSMQPVHLFLALVIFGIQYYLLLMIKGASPATNKIEQQN